MKRNKVIGPIVAALMLSSAPAMAADYGDVSNDTFTHVEFGSGWYLRGDITYNIDGREDRGRGVITSATSSSNLQYDYDDALGLRVGAGYYVAPNVRLEGTLESVFESNFSGQAYASFPGYDSDTATAVTVGGTEDTTASYTAGMLMVSGYLDAPKIGKFTPYIGGGIGLAQIDYSEKSVWTCIPGPATVNCTDPAGSAGTEATKTTTRDDTFVTTAWQLSAGTAIDLSENMALDIGYTFTQVGGGNNISYADGTAIDDDGFALHRLSAGIRYQLW